MSMNDSPRGSVSSPRYSEVEDAHPTIATLFHVALSHGEPLETGLLTRSGYDRFFVEAELTDAHFSDTGISSLMLQCLWDQHASDQVAVSSGIDLPRFASILSAVCHRCYVTMSANVPAEEWSDRSAVGSAGDAVLENLERSDAFRFCIEFVFGGYLRRSLVQSSQFTQQLKDAQEWSRLTQVVVADVLRTAVPIIVRVFDEFADDEGFLSEDPFLRMVRAMDVDPTLVDDATVAAVFDAVNTEDTKGLESGVIGAEVELDECISAIGLISFEAFGDAAQFPRHATIQSRLYSFGNMLLDAAAKRWGSAPQLQLPKRFTEAGSHDASSTSLAPTEPLVPLLSVIVPRIVTLSNAEGFFVGGAHFLTPVVDETALRRDVPWEQLLGHRNRNLQTVTHRLRVALMDTARGRHMRPTPKTRGSPSVTQKAHSVVGNEALPPAVTAAASSREPRGKTSFRRSGVLHDAQWLMSATSESEPSSIAAETPLFSPTRSLVLWCGGVELSEAYCVSSNRLRVTPEARCLVPSLEVAVIRGTVKASDWLEVSIQPAQRVNVQISRDRSAPRSRAIGMVICRTAPRSRPIVGPDALLLSRLFDEHAIDSRSETLSQHLMTEDSFHTARRLLQLPRATQLPRFPLSVQQEAHRKGVSENAWSELFRMFAAPLPRKDCGGSLRTTEVILCPDELAKVVHSDASCGVLSDHSADQQLHLTADGFLLCVLYGLAGALIEQRASSISCEALCIRLRALLSEARVRAILPLHAALNVVESAAGSNAAAPQEPVRTNVPQTPNPEALSKKKKKKKSASRRMPLAPRPPPPPAGTSRLMRPVPLLLPQSAFDSSPRRHRLPLIEFHSPQFIDDELQRIRDENPPSQRLKIEWSNEPLTARLQDVTVENTETVDRQPFAAFGSGIAPSPSRSPLGETVRDILEGTTAKLEPVHLITPSPEGRDRLSFALDSPAQLPVVPPLNTVPSVPTDELQRRVKATSSSLCGEYYTASMRHVQNLPQYSLKAFFR